MKCSPRKEPVKSSSDQSINQGGKAPKSWMKRNKVSWEIPSLREGKIEQKWIDIDSDTSIDFSSTPFLELKANQKSDLDMTKVGDGIAKE